VETESEETAKDAVSVVLGLNREGAHGLILARGTQRVVAVSSTDSAEQARDLLVGLCQALARQGMAPPELPAEATRAETRRSPSGVALEMDSHVAKHTLIIGDAGGFVAAASDEAIYPAMWSAELAAKTLHKALGSRHSQDVLMQFDAEWRMSMAEYLRSPNTDIQFLLPLIFSNQPMTDRMAAAFFAGENI
jgi:hypothetical protein